jgi:hypothetical protein
MKVYLDYNATTPVDKEAVHAMQPYFNDYFGNPSGSHSYGTETKLAVERTRKQVAEIWREIRDIWYRNHQKRYQTYRFYPGTWVRMQTKVAGAWKNSEGIAAVLEKYAVHACTDITGFGLVGHLSEVSVAGKENVELFADQAPVFEEVKNLAASGMPYILATALIEEKGEFL